MSPGSRKAQTCGKEIVDLLPYYGEQPLTVGNITVKVRTSDRKRTAELIKRTSKEVTTVNDQDSFTAARRAAGELKASQNEIYDSKRSAKRPFEAVLQAIEDLSK